MKKKIENFQIGGTGDPNRENISAMVNISAIYFKENIL